MHVHDQKHIIKDAVTIRKELSTYTKLSSSAGIVVNLLWIRQQSADSRRVDDDFRLIELRGVRLGQRSIMTAQTDVLQKVLQLVLVDEHVAQQVLYIGWAKRGVEWAVIGWSKLRLFIDI